MEDINYLESENLSQFESRKRDHLNMALKKEHEALKGSMLDRVWLEHEALPEIDFDKINISSAVLGSTHQTPFVVSSMTAGHSGSVDLNYRLAEASAKRGWLMGVGSQRRELSDPEALKEWQGLRLRVPEVRLLGNIGLAQLILSSPLKIQKLVDALQAEAMIVHLNALQEALQPEGTRNFSGGLKALEQLVATLDVPVIVKETGCGMSVKAVRRLAEVGVSVVDISGYGGTHWGRIEGDRAAQLKTTQAQTLARVSKTFSDWGIPTAVAMKKLAEAGIGGVEVWASGGVRSGLDAAKLLAMGAKAVGFAKPILEAALQGVDTLDQRMDQIEQELRTALFCTGHATVSDLQKSQSWGWMR